MADSAFAAVVDRIQSFNGLPALYTFDAPTSVGGTQIYPPYIVIQDNGTQANYEFTHTVMEVSDFTLLVYANQLADVDGYVEKIKYNGGAIDAGAGLDFGALPTLTADYGNMEVRRLSERHFAAVATGKESQRIHACEMRYRVTLYRYTAN